jgi:hypothetical protein
LRILMLFACPPWQGSPQRASCRAPPNGSASWRSAFAMRDGLKQAASKFPRQRPGVRTISQPARHVWPEFQD